MNEFMDWKLNLLLEFFPFLVPFLTVISVSIYLIRRIKRALNDQ